MNCRVSYSNSAFFGSERTTIPLGRGFWPRRRILATLEYNNTEVSTTAKVAAQGIQFIMALWRLRASIVVCSSDLTGFAKLAEERVPAKDSSQITGDGGAAFRYSLLLLSQVWVILKTISAALTWPHRKRLPAHRCAERHKESTTGKTSHDRPGGD